MDQLIEQDQNGKRAGSGWKKEAWTVVVSNFNTRFKTNYNKDQMKSAVMRVIFCICFNQYSDMVFAVETNLGHFQSPEK